ncbi:MAG: NADH-quinone oxidoreductase subunit L, partial [Nitrospiraceae bacterium]
MYDLIVTLIPVFPLLAVLANGLNVMLGHRYSHDIAHRLAWGSVLLSFLCSVWVLGQTLAHPAPRNVIVYRWFFGADLTVNFGFLIDPLTCIMLLVVTG